MDDALQDYLDLWDKRMEAAKILPEDQQNLVRFAYLIIQKDLAIPLAEKHKLESK